VTDKSSASKARQAKAAKDGIDSKANGKTSQARDGEVKSLLQMLVVSNVSLTVASFDGINQYVLRVKANVVPPAAGAVLQNPTTGMPSGPFCAIYLDDDSLGTGPTEPPNEAGPDQLMALDGSPLNNDYVGEIMHIGNPGDKVYAKVWARWYVPVSDGPASSVRLTLPGP
jgi:hypothetical protein